MEERLLTRTSDNISKLLSLMITHEYNVKNYIRSNRNIDIQFVFDRLAFDISQNIQNLHDISQNGQTMQDISQNMNIRYTTFGELENTNEMMCPITQESFISEDNVALLDCGHYFKKDAFMVWARRSRACPSCRAYFR